MFEILCATYKNKNKIFAKRICVCNTVYLSIYSLGSLPGNPRDPSNDLAGIGCHDDRIYYHGDLAVCRHSDFCRNGACSHGDVCFGRAVCNCPCKIYNNLLTI